MKKFYQLVLLFLFTSSVFATPPNLGLIKKEVIQYYQTGTYSKELASAINSAKMYIDQRIAQPTKKPLAIVLDIDETSLSNIKTIIDQNFSASAEQIHQNILEANAPVIKPMLSLYNDAKAKGVKVFFVTGRQESERDATKVNLLKAGYKDWAGLYLRPTIYNEQSIVAFKSNARAEIEKQGYIIIASIGDQASDIKGGFTEKGFKLPNPFYFLP